MSEIKPLTVQDVVDIMGNYIVIRKLNTSKITTKAFGEVEINNTIFQVQISLVPKSKGWIPVFGIHQEKTKSWKQKILNLFISIMDAGMKKLK